MCEGGERDLQSILESTNNNFIGKNSKIWKNTLAGILAISVLALLFIAGACTRKVTPAQETNVASKPQELPVTYESQETPEIPETNALQESVEIPDSNEPLTPTIVVSKPSTQSANSIYDFEKSLGQKAENHEPSQEPSFEPQQQDTIAPDTIPAATTDSVHVDTVIVHSEAPDTIRQASSDTCHLSSMATEHSSNENELTNQLSHGEADRPEQSAGKNCQSSNSQFTRPWLALRTNLLYDAALIPNIGLEVALGNHLTLGVDWFATWLSSDTYHWYWQGYGGYLTARYYWGKANAEQRFTGHHVGIYGTALTYDVEWGGKGYQAAKFGFGGGVEYGYSLSVARNLTIDFNLGLGYQGGEYKEYLPTDDGTGHYVWVATYKRNWWGPTKAEISLKWLIGPTEKKEKSEKGGIQ